VSVGLGGDAQAQLHLTALFYRMTARLGMKKAIVAVAHQILVTAFSILRDHTEYRELGGDFFDQQHPQRTQNRLVRKLERLGLQVVITPAKPLPILLNRTVLVVVLVNVLNWKLSANTGTYNSGVFKGLKNLDWLRRPNNRLKLIRLMERRTSNFLGIRLFEDSLFVGESNFRGGDFTAIWIGAATRVSRGLIRRDLLQEDFLGVTG
jgi:hypothetical protein